MNLEIALVMVCAPLPGTVKYRLTREQGAAAATALYRCMVEETLEVLRDDVHEVAVVCETPAVGEGWLDVPIWTERGPRRAVKRAFDTGYQRVVLVKSDMPHLCRNRVRAAFTALSSFDMVIGPSHDGGYYLLGLRGCHDVFSGIEGGTSSVFKQTLERGQGLRTMLLPADFDIDRKADLEALKVGRTAALWEQFKVEASRVPSN